MYSQLVAETPFTIVAAVCRLSIAVAPCPCPHAADCADPVVPADVGKVAEDTLGSIQAVKGLACLIGVRAHRLLAAHNGS